MTSPRPRWGILFFFFTGMCAIHCPAHTLPISYLTLVQDKNYLHAELTLNPFELNFMSEIDANQDNVLDSAELRDSDKLLSKRILQHIKIRADGKFLSAETAGISGEPGGHHFILRAHFPTANVPSAVSVESDLAAITSASHLTEVTFVKEGKRELARLDSQKHQAAFGSSQSANAATPPDLRKGVSTPGFLMILPLTILPLLLGIFLFLKFTKNPHRESASQS